MSQSCFYNTVKNDYYYSCQLLKLIPEFVTLCHVEYLYLLTHALV